jgi:hypothetical protein
MDGCGGFPQLCRARSVISPTKPEPLTRHGPNPGHDQPRAAKRGGGPSGSLGAGGLAVAAQVMSQSRCARLVLVVRRRAPGADRDEPAPWGAANLRFTTRVVHREPPGGSDGPGLCSSFEGVNRKGFPCPTFVRPGRPAPPRRVAADRQPLRSARRAAPRFPRRRVSSCAARPTARAMGFWPHARSRPARLSWSASWSGRRRATTRTRRRSVRAAGRATAAWDRRSTTPATPTAVSASTTGRPSTSSPASRSAPGRS